MVMPAKWAAMVVLGGVLAGSGALAVAENGRQPVVDVELPVPSEVVMDGAKVAEICRGEGEGGYLLGERVVSMGVYEAVCCYEGSEAPDCGVQPTVAEAN